MAERLTVNEPYCGCCEWRTDCMRAGGEKRGCNIVAMYNKLKGYEDLEEQGRLIELPCKIGDTVWDIKWWDDITETKVIDGEKYFRRVMKHKVTKSKFSLFDYDNFGKTVFLTREEAEAALKEVGK